MNTGSHSHQIILPADLSSALETLGTASGSTKSAVLAEALQAWLAPREGTEPDPQLGPRLERIGRAQERAEEKLAWIAGMLGAFVEYQLTLVAHRPAFPPETVHLGQERYRAFVDAVGRKLVRGGDVLGEPDGGDVVGRPAPD